MHTFHITGAPCWVYASVIPWRWHSDISHRLIPMVPHTSVPQFRSYSATAAKRWNWHHWSTVVRIWVPWIQTCSQTRSWSEWPEDTSYGVSGPVESVISHVDPEIGKGHEHYSFRIPVRILFSNTDYYAPTLLGRKGFFEKFKITIDESVQKVVLRAVED